MFPPVRYARTPLTTLNPLVGLAVIAIVTVITIVSFDPIAVLIILAVELPLLPLARIGVRGWLFRTWPLATGLAGIMIANLLFTDIRTGSELLSAGPLVITTGSLGAAAVVVLRVLVLAIPGIVFFARMDPTALADALIAHWHANPRIAVGSLAALRMAPLVAADLRQSYAARRTRGLVSRNPVVMMPMIIGTLGTLLVTTVRRATRLSAAMDSRGFDSGVPRTIARVSTWRRRDWLVILGYGLAGAIAVGVTISGNIR
ncbi:energy-coupling factor transporter transmembrane protein EcfT [Microlunatus sp. Gsoil 973]|uniref:energy-coupling factor transporter transmembrane component T family protein n=1 Tax=Microlunatus sp. Gsoil 973 TaxID=2672569 RepID=UPI0012B45E95|nr:energy-coupling factor transporter transmembrane component T [Microlunatus sp. Gsoil 973]QGN33284.1 energy-coupling factor transporter transmembrane protein EcfT [Microlunatus sp. Gsoil 973]